MNVKTKQKQSMYTTCSELVVFFMYQPGKSINNLFLYCGLVDARISASEKDLPVSNQSRDSHLQQRTGVKFH